LMASQSYHQTSAEFDGLGPGKLFISLTTITVVSLFALFMELFVIGWADMISWISRVGFKNWWLVKSSSPRHL
jgi:hypothetical protein